MQRSVIYALTVAIAGGAAGQVTAQESTSDLVDFMIRPSQDALAEKSPADEDVWDFGAGSEAEMLPAALPVPEAPVSAPAPEAPRRARRPDDVDPFEPVGIRTGTFILRPSIEIGVSATDNAQGSPDGESAVGALIAPALSIRSDWSRHEFEADMAGVAVLYGDDEIDEREAYLRAAGRMDVTEDTALDASADYALTLENFTDPNTPAGAVERPSDHELEGAVGVTHRFNRVSVRLGGEVEREIHEEVALAGGGTGNRGDLDYTSYGLRLRGAIEAGPAFTPYLEVAAGRKDYDHEVDANDFRRSGDWGELRGGLLFDLGPKTQGEVSLGYYREDLEDPGLEDLSGMVADASLLWSPRRLTTIRFALSTDVSPTSIAGASGSFVYAGALTVTRQVRSRLRLEAGLGIEHERFVGADLHETTFTGFVGVSYALSRTASLHARYAHEFSDDGEEARINTVTVRLRVQR